MAAAAAQVPKWVQRVKALELDDGEAVLFELMTNFHSFMEAHQYLSLRNHGGYGFLCDLNQWRYKDIKDWCSAMTSRPVNRGGRTYGDLKVKQLQGILWWVTDCILRNKELNVSEYKADPDGYRMNAE